jgi:hypothetical protein
MISENPTGVDDRPEILPYNRPAKQAWKNQPQDKPLTDMLESFSVLFFEAFYHFYHKEEEKGLAEYKPELYFTIEHARGITQKFD